MRRSPTTRRYAAPAALALALVLGACSGGDDSSGSDDETPNEGSSPSSASSGTVGSEAADPAAPETNILDWNKAKVSNDTFIAGSKVDMVVPEGGAEARITGVGQGGRTVVPAGKNKQITDSFIGSTHAVVVAQDKNETKPQTVTLVDLKSGKTSTVDDPPPGAGGPWAMSGSTIDYATYSPGSDYCLATYDVDSKKGEKGFCAEQGNGFSNVAVTPHGTTLMSFDHKRPVSCRTLVLLDGEKSVPIEGVPDCKGWEAVATEDGYVWSSLPKENQVERGEFHATVDGKDYDLGAGAASTLTWCGDSAYFVRDSGRGRPAQMLRWTPDHTLEIVYESPGKGQAFLSPPTCSENVLSVSAYGQGGDERVTATVPG